MLFSNDSNHERSWWYYVGRVTAVQVLLIILCFIVRIAGDAIASMWSGEVLLAAVILVFLYLPGVIVIGGSESIHMSASAGWILLLFSFAFYSVLFGSLVYFAHRYIQFLRSNGEARPYQPLSEPEPETWNEPVETSTAIPEGEELSDTAAEESVEEQDELEIPAESEPAADPPKNRGMRWLRCVIGVTAMQPILLLLCLVAPDSLLAAGIMTYFYLPARLLVDGFGLPAPVVLILFLVSVVVFSVVFGTVVCFGGPLAGRMFRRASAFKRRERPGKKSSAFPNIEQEGKVKWGCCVSVLIVLFIPLAIYCLFNLDHGGLGSLYERYVYKPVEWLLEFLLSHYDSLDLKILPFLFFLLLVVGTFYSVLFGSLFYWLCRELHCLFKFLSRKIVGK